MGRRRTDLLIEWNDKKRYVIELKVLHKSLEQTVETGVQQILEYMDKAGTETGNLLIFNRDPEIGWEEKIFQSERQLNEKRIFIWGM